MAGSPMKTAALRQGHRNRSSLAVIEGGSNTSPAPPAPKGLLARTTDLWLDFWSSDVSQAVDRRSDMHALIRWIKAVDEYERALPTLRKYRMVKGSTGQPVLNPLASYVSSLEASIRATEKAFGMDPQSRIHLGLTYGQVQLTAARINAMIEGSDDIDAHAAEIDDWDPA